MKELAGDAAEALILSQIEAHSKGIEKALAPFDVQSAVKGWLDTIRAIEEFINLPLSPLYDDALEHTVAGVRLDILDKKQLDSVRAELSTRFGSALASRFQVTVLQAATIAQAFRRHGFFEAAAGLQSVKHAAGYFQSRRRHLVALLYTLPHACRGGEPFLRIDSLNKMLPQVEISGMTIVGMQHQLMLAKVFPDFRLLVDERGFKGNRSFQSLDELFLEPERANILEMHSQREHNNVPELEAVDPYLVFSAAEARNNLRVIEWSYEEFDLPSTPFGPVSDFLTACLQFCRDDYFIEIAETKLDELFDKADVPMHVRGRIVHKGDGYVESLEEYAPFIAVGSTRYSTVTLMTRFAYYWKSVCLNRVRRFQIRSGFIFEESVKETLSGQGFSVSNIKRINRKEFDVVATLGDTIYNVQCKNNLVDLEKIATNPTLFARYNRNLDRYYAKALRKEEAREKLLQDQLGLSKVSHVVLSRFPVATDNPRVLPFSQIASFRSRFAA